jgi:putative cell wall-binding protein
MTTTAFTRRRYATAAALATAMAGAASVAAEAPAHASTTTTTTVSKPTSAAPALSGHCPNAIVYTLISVPYAQAIGPAPLTISVDLTGNTVDPTAGCAMIFHWGDGTPDTPAVAENIPVKHTFTKPGKYSITYITTIDFHDGHGPQVNGNGGFQVIAEAPGATGGGIPVSRIGGTDRYATGRQVSQAQWQAGKANAVVLARGDQAPDALAGVPLAAHVKGPLLLTDPHALDAATRAEIDRVTGGPQTHKTVYILGGESAVSPTVAAGLQKAGYTVVRYGGTSRYDTALKIAGAFGPTQHVIVATGKNFPDALAAGPLGAAENAPIVLSDDTAMDPATQAFVSQHPDIDPVGGQALQAVLLNTHGKTVNAGLAGADRYATGTAVANQIVNVLGHFPTSIGVASGTTFPDALTGGAYAANAGEPLLLTAPGSLPSTTAGLLAGWASQFTAVTVFGGQSAISGPTFAAIVKAVHGSAA